MIAGILLASNSLTLRVLTLAHVGEYSCVARNTVGEIHSPPLFIHMKCEWSLLFISQPRRKEIYFRQNELPFAPQTRARV